VQTRPRSKSDDSTNNKIKTEPTLLMPTPSDQPKPEQLPAKTPTLHLLVDEKC